MANNLPLAIILLYPFNIDNIDMGDIFNFNFNFNFIKDYMTEYIYVDTIDKKEYDKRLKNILNIYLNNIEYFNSVDISGSLQLTIKKLTFSKFPIFFKKRYIKKMVPFILNAERLINNYLEQNI